MPRLHTYKIHHIAGCLDNILVAADNNKHSLYLLLDGHSHDTLDQATLPQPGQQMNMLLECHPIRRTTAFLVIAV